VIGKGESIGGDQKLAMTHLEAAMTQPKDGGEIGQARKALRYPKKLYFFSQSQRHIIRDIFNRELI